MPCACYSFPWSSLTLFGLLSPTSWSPLPFLRDVHLLVSAFLLAPPFFVLLPLSPLHPLQCTPDQAHPCPTPLQSFTVAPVLFTVRCAAARLASVANSFAGCVQYSIVRLRLEHYACRAWLVRWLLWWRSCCRCAAEISGWKGKAANCRQGLHSRQ